MKIKLLFLTIASLLLTYLIFTTSIDNRLDIISLLPPCYIHNIDFASSYVLYHSF